MAHVNTADPDRSLVRYNHQQLSQSDDAAVLTEVEA